jgi:hypothetical protein
MDGSICARATAICSLLFIAGCVNGFERFYKPSPNADQILKSPYNAPVNAIPLIFDYSNNPKVDNHNAMRAGYVYVGSADFYANARKVSQSQLIAQAKSVGASLVLIHTSFKDTVSGSVPFTVQNAPIVSTVSTSGTVNAYGSGGYATGTYSASGTITTPGGTTTYQMPYQFDRNNYDATFWVKRDTSKIILGINPGPLSDTQKRDLQRNSGIVAAVVVNGTPAFQANILEGDILLKVNDEDFVEPATMVAQMEKYAGQKVTFQIVRDGQPRSISVALRPSQTR